ncbi:FUSC family protein [Tropicimonas sp. IMCC34043]|uniref:FUSC family protein n=1 Tax=Tropicimonas sp. IMCC34043 TaxID=2248760 RepID=UPI000E244338|nr:FUSC family protein [Tropicimonas sp. IMCC34043]
MTTAARSPWPQIVRQAWDDLQPFPGRFGLTWRVALLCAFVTATAMILKIPEASISCYLIIFLMKQDAVQNCIMGFGLILLATGVVVMMIPLINVSIDSPALRLAVIFLATYVFLFLSSTTPLGEQAAIVGLIIAFIMTLVSNVPVGQIGNQGLLAAWKMACMPMFLMILFNLVLGIPAQTHVRNKIVDRLRCAADRIGRADKPDTFDDLLGEGNDQALQQMMLVRVLHLVPAARSRWLNGAVETSYRILIAVEALPETTGDEVRADLAGRLRAAAHVIAGGGRPEAAGDILPPPADAATRTAFAALAGLSQPDGGGDPRPRKIPLLAADAFSNPDHQRYALKTAVAATLCYLIYTGIQWNGIHTAMITCYVAALGTTGETVRKLTLRIVGCLIGAAMGAFALAFVMPHLTSIGGLMAMVFCGILVGAWVSSGNERIYYAGVQIALAFLLTTLNGFGPSFEISQASNRIYGILLGIFVIYVIFTQFWPRSVVKAVLLNLSTAFDALIRLGTLPDSDQRARTEAATAAQIALAQAEELLDMAPFEPARQRAEPAVLDRLGEILDETRGLASRLYFAEQDAGDIARRLHVLKTRLSADMLSEQADPGTAPSSGLPKEQVTYGDLEQQLARVERIAKV